MSSCRWATLTGRVRAQRFFEGGNQSQNKETIGETSSSSNPFGKLKESANRFLESSMYALCCRSRLQLGPRTTLSSTSELETLSRHSLADQRAVGPLAKVPWRGRVALRHKVLTPSYLHILSSKSLQIASCCVNLKLFTCLSAYIIFRMTVSKALQIASCVNLNHFTCTHSECCRFCSVGSTSNSRGSSLPRVLYRS